MSEDMRTGVEGGEFFSGLKDNPSGKEGRGEDRCVETGDLFPPSGSRGDEVCVCLLDIVEFKDGTSGNLRAGQFAHHFGGLIRGKYCVWRWFNLIGRN